MVLVRTPRLPPGSEREGPGAQWWDNATLPQVSSAQLSSAQLSLAPITAAQRRHSVSYPLAAHHSPSVGPLQSNASRLGRAAPK